MSANVLRYFRLHLFTLLFAWLSFAPLPLHGKFFFVTLLFLVLFFDFLMLDKDTRRAMMNLRDWRAYLFLITLPAGVIAASHKAVALKGFFYLIVIFFFVYHIGKGLIRREEDIEAICVIICLCGSLVASFGLVEFFSRRNILYELIQNPFYARYVGSRIMSTQFNPTVLGTYFLGVIPAAFYLFHSKPRYGNIVAVITVVLCTTVLLFTYSRGVFLSFAAVVLFFMWKMGGRKFLLWLFAAIISLVIFCSLQNNILMKRFGGERLLVGSSDSAISEYRVERLQMAMRMFRAHPFFGVGFNHFRIVFPAYLKEKDVLQGTLWEFRVADNMYLTLLSETGLIGAIGFLIFISFLVKDGIDCYAKIDNEKIKLGLLVFLSSLLGILVNMGSYELFYWNNPYMLFCLFCGLVKSLEQRGSVAGSGA